MLFGSVARSASMWALSIATHPSVQSVAEPPPVDQDLSTERCALGRLLVCRERALDALAGPWTDACVALACAGILGARVVDRDRGVVLAPGLVGCGIQALGRLSVSLSALVARGGEPEADRPACRSLFGVEERASRGPEDPPGSLEDHDQVLTLQALLGNSLGQHERTDGRWTCLGGRDRGRDRPGR